MKAIEVFTPGRTPSVTYVDNHLKEKGTQLLDALEMGNLLIAISGPSKSGKTVFIENLLGKERLIQVTGAGINKPEDLWLRVFDILGTPISQSQSGARALSATLGAKASAQAGIVLAKGSAEGSVSGGITNTNTTTEGFSVDYLQLLKNDIAGTEFIVFIDDFHYIEKSVQQEIAKQIKDAISSGCKFICASVPYHSDDVIRGNADLRGRILSIDFDYWKTDGLEQIATKGFSHLNISPEKSLVDTLVAESAGSPQLMQYLYLNSCFESGVRDVSPTQVHLKNDKALIDRICKRTVMSADYSSVVDKMEEGPKIRGSDRKVYFSKYGWQGDVYTFLKHALAQDPPQLTFRYDDLLRRMSSLCLSDTPSGSSVTSACLHSSNIANSTANDSIIEWDEENDVLDIRDPYLLFYLRWA
ncbi:hypothetical protein [Pantoea septica]|uniref:hypothetical protein n=2 Tax=Pantoea septica TaxID=472695 RepID=UPI0028A85EFB|nr:hypothetical protein [Pantoea septica]